MKYKIFQYFVVIFFLLPIASFAEWGKIPSLNELANYSSASMGFATQNLESPISNFGHTFIVFHNNRPPEADSIIVEFTGDAPDLSAAISALFTKVPGKYSLMYLAEKIREYDYENRSIWIYQLKTTKDDLQSLKQYFLQSENANFEYDFSQKNCAFYVTQALTHSIKDLTFRQDGLFVTPISTLRWARSKNMFASEIFLPSSQLRALNSYENLSLADQQCTTEYLRKNILPSPENTKKDIGYALSVISEHLVPRESSPSQRNYLFSIKQNFPAVASASNDNPHNIDPSYSIGQSTISTQFLPMKNAFIFSISPGFIRPENEAAANQKNSRVEALSTDLYTDTHGTIQIEKFHLVRVEANQPGGYLKNGFTHAFDISYINYRTYLDQSYQETKISYGKGASWLVLDTTISVLPLASAISSNQDNVINNFGQIELRLNVYKQFNGNMTGFIQINQSLLQNSEIRQTANFDLIHSLKRDLNISIIARHLEGRHVSSTLYGLGLSASF